MHGSANFGKLTAGARFVPCPGVPSHPECLQNATAAHEAGGLPRAPGASPDTGAAGCCSRPRPARQRAPRSTPVTAALSFDEALTRRREGLPLSKPQLALLLGASERWIERNLKPTTQVTRDGRVFYFWDDVEAQLRASGREGAST